MGNNLRAARAAYFSTIVIAAAIATLGETDCFEVGALAADGSSEFAVATAMELLTIAAIPTSLKLASRWRGARGQWLFAPMAALLVANTLLYYIYMAVAFGYMAIILLLSLVFAYPKQTEKEGGA